MDKHDLQVLEKIYAHTQSIIDYCNGCDLFKSFQNNKMLIEACVFNLMQIGELAKATLSDKAKSQLTTIPWKQLYGMRNKIVHGYSGIDLTIVWETIYDDIPKLNKELKKYI